MALSKFDITGGIPENLTQLILDDVHQLLADVGVEIQHAELRKELVEHDGVTVKGDRVCYTPDLVERARKQVPEEDTNYATQNPGDTRFRIQPPFSPFDVMDFETGQKRPAEDQDVIDGARLYDAFDSEGPVHVHIKDMDQNIVQVHLAKLCCENSRAIGSWAPAFTYEQAVTIRDMFLAAGRKEPYVAFQMTHSPMRLDRYSLDILMKARKSENGTLGLTAGGGAMPLPGISAPIYYRSAAAQGLAECLGGWITAKLIDPNIKPYASFLVWAPDMSTCKWGSFTPESILFDLLNRQVIKEILGITAGSGCGHLYLMCMAALQGARIFGGAGSRKDGFSLAHIPIDQEKVNYVRAFATGYDFPEDPGMTVRIVQETFPQTSFLMHESSLEYRTLYWHPEVFKGMMPPELTRMLFQDSPELLSRSKQIAKDRLKEHSFELAPDIRKDVEKIYDAGCKAIAKAGNQ